MIFLVASIFRECVVFTIARFKLVRGGWWSVVFIRVIGASRLVFGNF